MIHPILDQHESIAWDFDGTLSSEMHEAPNGAFFLAYIAAHPEKRHHVITFRNKAWAMIIWKTLREVGLDTSLIRSIESCPEPIHDCYQIAEQFKNSPDCHMYYRANPMLTRAQFDANASRFVGWKAERAKQIGCTVLVDDIPEWVEDGCVEHGVEFLHAHAPCPRF